MKAAEAHDTQMETVHQKASALSYKRGAKTTRDNDVMFEKLLAMLKDHYDQGILQTPYPASSQVGVGVQGVKIVCCSCLH